MKREAMKTNFVAWNIKIKQKKVMKVDNYNLHPYWGPDFNC